MPKPFMIPKKSAKKFGEDTLLNPTRQAALLKAIEQGMPLKQAAAIAGMSYDTLNNWQIAARMKVLQNNIASFLPATTALSGRCYAGASFRNQSGRRAR